MRRNQPFFVAFARRARRTAFTLVELLVVISIVALLTAILMPCLQRVRNQAKGVACQGQLRQWGIVFSAYASNNEGRLFPNGLDAGGIPRDGIWPDVASPANESFWSILMAFDPYFDEHYKMLLCPAATKLNESAQTLAHEGGRTLYGGTYTPYRTGKLWSWRMWRVGPVFLASYGVNGWAVDYPSKYVSAGGPGPVSPRSFYWEGATSKHASQVPVFLDCRYTGAQPVDGLCAPPAFEDEPPHWAELNLVVMNRHSGGTNSLFLDWSVRKIGVKEPWMLKWHGEYDTAGPWTKRSGAEPEDWPAWMRRFKDY